MTKASRHLFYIVAGFSLGLAGLASLAYSGLAERGPLGSASIGGPFAMTAQDGRVVTNRELEGRPYLVFFGYTHCPDFCPTALLDISEVFKELGPDKKIAALFITVDPARDTPETLKTYLENFDPRIIGLTGDPAKTEAIAKAFKVYVKKGASANGDYTVDHTGVVYLMDKRGRFVNAFNLSKPPKQAARELENYL
ncbi:SCO family protein [Methylocapsa polymorpha]|uniref:SCO family protein n=1 Tax=Methylocapsa polymorpha TaxID=3080828 RepID=A0ABZ0HU82_9HYPH|nr:SCO family protein [Methylocapsa sp. RX1]